MEGHNLTEGPERQSKFDGGADEAMKVDQLKAELAERGSTRSGRKAILRPGSHNSD